MRLPWRHTHKWRFIHRPFEDYQERVLYAPADCECGEFKDVHVEAMD